MIVYKCTSCGRTFNPEKDEICPRCGDAVAPSVLTRIERKNTAQRLRAEGKFDYDEHCHEDDAWSASYGADVHRTAVQIHEASLRAKYSAHKPADNPTHLSNANPTAQPYSRPAVRTASAAKADPNDPDTGKSGKQAQERPKFLRWIVIAWIIYILYHFFFN